jgi:flagellar biosynthetic protein FliO
MTMPGLGRSAASNHPMARRLDVRPATSGRRVATLVCLAGVAGVALVGTLHPLPVAGVGQPAATAGALSAASSTVASVWDGGNATGGLNWIDLITKGTIVLALLFVTLRVLSRLQAGSPKPGHRLEVLESRPLAPKASLHLVAIGERRLVIGLTPSGMVSLAELDATELEADSEAAALAEDSATAPAAGARVAGGLPQPTLGSALNWALGPLDAVTGRLASLLSGGRVR